MNRTLTDTLDRTAKIIARRANVRLVSRGDEHPRTDGRTIYLPAMPEPCPPHIERMWHGVLDHETGHILYTDFKAARRCQNHQSRFGAKAFEVLNAVEDIRIEARLVDEFPGSADNLKHTHQEMDRRWREILGSKEVSLW